MKTLIELKAAVKVELTNLLLNPSYQNDEREAEILTAFKDACGYDYSLDEKRNDFCLLATQPEIWEYWLNVIIPRIESIKTVLEFINQEITNDNLVYFLTACMKELIFHPDTPFEDYIVLGTDERCFSDEEANALNSRLNEAFEVSNSHGHNIYDMCMEIENGEDGKQY